MLTFLILGACFLSVMQCYERSVAQSGQQLKAVSPVKCLSQFGRQRKGEERLPAKEWIEAMPADTLRFFALNILTEFGMPKIVTTAAAIERRMEQAS